MSIPGTRQASADTDTKHRILAAATALFARHGYAATSLDSICQRAGVTKPVIYWHFENKEGLLAAALEALATRWIAQIRERASVAGSPQARLQQMTAGWRRLVDEDRDLLLLPLAAALEGQNRSERVRAGLRRVWQRAEEAIVEGIEEALGTRLPDLDLVAHVAVTLLQGAMLRHSVNQDPKRLERDLGELRRVVSLLIVARFPREVQRTLWEAAEPASPPQRDS